MAVTVSTGPAVSGGPLLGYPARAPDNNTLAGPSITYQGDTIPDVRFGMLGGNERPGAIRTHLDSPYVLMTDAVPSASAATPVNIAAAQTTVSGTALTLAGPSAGISTAIPFKPLAATTDLGAPVYGDGALQISALTLDLGFTTVATTAGSAVVTLPNAAAINQNIFTIGQSLVIGGAGNAGGTLPLITTITAINGLALTLASPAAATLAAAPVGQGDMLDLGALTPSTAWVPRIVAGAAGIFNPADAISRGVGIACSATGGGGVFLVRGWDIYGMPMSEAITHPGGAVTVYGRKALKHLGSVTPQFTDATRTYSVGTSDLFGLNLRSDKIEYANFYFAATFNGSAAGWTPADVTSPATTTTGDVRGTVQIGNRGPLGTNNGFGTSPSDGVKRLALFTSIPLFNLISATPSNPAPLYGVNQA